MKKGTRVNNTRTPQSDNDTLCSSATQTDSVSETRDSIITLSDRERNLVSLNPSEKSKDLNLNHERNCKAPAQDTNSANDQRHRAYKTVD